MALVEDPERLWDDLLAYVEEGSVVPVVGRDLLTVVLDRDQATLYEHLARRLARYLKQDQEPPPGSDSLNVVAARHFAGGGRPESLYSSLKAVMPFAEELRPPKVLMDLAAISAFRLFLTTTFDSLMQQALDQTRFGGESRTEVRAYATGRPDDLPAQTDRPVVYHLLGRLAARPVYAVTDEDVLEFMHALQSPDKQPTLLFDTLRSHSLLVLGSGFPDWLARFFLRTTRSERLLTSTGRTDWLADGLVQAHTGLVFFLEHFSRTTRLFPGPASTFVTELHARWTARQRRVTSVPLVQTATMPSPMAVGAVFLSYASEDAALALDLKDELEAGGIDVWLDKERLEGGDSYERKIYRNIESCSVFVPLISRHTLNLAKPRFFRLEWSYAERVARQLPPNRRFVVPVVIDDTPATADEIPEAFRELHLVRLLEKHAASELNSLLRQLYRDHQRVLAGVQ